MKLELHLCSVTFLQIACLFLGALLLHGNPREVAQRYEEAFSIAESLPDDAARFMANPMSEDVANLERALDLIRENAGAEAVDWGMNWETAHSSQFSWDQHRNLRRLARTAVAYHEGLLDRGGHERFVEDMAAILRAGRQFADGQALSHFQNAVAVEAIVREALAKNVSRLPPEVLDEMLQRWQATPPGPSLAKILEAERLVMRSGLWDAFAGTTDLGEPSLKLAGQGSDLAENLRVSSYLSLAGEVWIGFEDAETGASFRLRIGDSRHGLELVSVQTDPIRALVRRGEEFALIGLEGRRLVPVGEAAAWKRVSDLIQQIARTEEQAETGRELLTHLLEEADGDKLAAFEALIARFDAEAERITPLLNTSYADLPDPEKVATEGPGIFGELIAPFLLRFEYDRRASEELLLAGLTHLRDPQAPLPRSEVTGEPIRMAVTEEGMVFESTFQRRGRPLTVIFPLRERDPQE